MPREESRTRHGPDRRRGARQGLLTAIDGWGKACHYEKVEAAFSVIPDGQPALSIVGGAWGIEPETLREARHRSPGTVARLLQPHTVSVPFGLWRHLRDAGLVTWWEPDRFEEQFAVMLSGTDHYDDRAGVRADATRLSDRSPAQFRPRARRRHRQQRAMLCLRDVAYGIEAHFEMTGKAGPEDNPGKHAEMFRRHAERGQCFHQPCLGVREFPADFELVDAIPETELAEPERDRDLGWMVELDLTPGPYCSVGAQYGWYPATDNVSLAFGTIIEDAIGGSGSDTLRKRRGDTLPRST